MACTMVGSAIKCRTYTLIGDGGGRDFASPPASGSGCPGVVMHVLVLLTSKRRILFLFFLEFCLNYV